jgi:GDPmannose 4,6-dehydratase
MGLQKSFQIGNLDAERDWGHSKDYVEAMWLMLQQDSPEDYVIGTGEKHTVREFIEKSAETLGMNIKSNGKIGVEERYIDENGEVVIEVSPIYFRPAEVDLLQASPKKAMEKLHWKPKISFKELVELMAKHDLKLAEKEAYLKNKK